MVKYKLWILTVWIIFIAMLFLFPMKIEYYFRKSEIDFYKKKLSDKEIRIIRISNNKVNSKSTGNKTIITNKKVIDQLRLGIIESEWYRPSHPIAICSYDLQINFIDGEILKAEILNTKEDGTVIYLYKSNDEFITVMKNNKLDSIICDLLNSSSH